MRTFPTWGAWLACAGIACLGVACLPDSGSGASGDAGGDDATTDAGPDDWTHPACGKEVKPNQVEWSPTRPLAWSDFAGAPPTTPGEEEALISLQFCNTTPICINGLVRLTFNAAIGTKDSWVTAAASGDGPLLVHEQGHFDIAEIYAREFNDTIRNPPFTCKTQAEYNASAAQINVLLKSNSADLKSHEDAYDTDTKHGADHGAQAEWNAIIADCLKRYRRGCLDEPPPEPDAGVDAPSTDASSSDAALDGGG